MNTCKNQNSILVLATLGVYLGLVLVGATPQVLAHAAMTRQFNVKDEVEVKDNLDKDPRNEAVESETSNASATDKNITRSVERFVSQFRTTHWTTAILPSVSSDIDGHDLQTPAVEISACRVVFVGHLNRILTVTRLPRAGLASLLI